MESMFLFWSFLSNPFKEDPAGMLVGSALTVLGIVVIALLFLHIYQPMPKKFFKAWKWNR